MMNDQTILALSEHASSSRRRQALESLFAMEGAERAKLALRLLRTEYKDVRDGIFDLASAQLLSSDKAWEEAIIAEVENKDLLAKDALWRQNLLVLIGRFDGILAEPLVKFYRSHLDDADEDVCYQALCLAELQLESGDAYLERLKTYTQSADEDLRIVAAQGIGRLKPDWAALELSEMARYASGQEAFHILLARLGLKVKDEQLELVEELKAYLEDERYAYPSILALGTYGSASDIDTLLSVARSFFGEPTLKVAAAEAAATLGSAEGLKLLKDFAQAKGGNPSYAAEALERLKPSLTDEAKPEDDA